MKRLLPIALLSFLLAGCVKQSDYDALVEENENLKAEIDDLNRDSKEDEELSVTSDISDNEVETLVYNTLSDDFAGTLTYGLTRNKDGKLALTIVYHIDIFKSQYIHEQLHLALVGNSFDLFDDYVKNMDLDIFSISTTDKQYEYCNSMVIYSPTLFVVTCYERDGTETDAFPEWMNDIYYGDGYDAKSVDWIVDSVAQIEADIKPYFE